MTQMERYKALLRRIAPNPLCDDCSAQKLGFSQRQRAYQLSSAVAASSNFQRQRDICYSCKSSKLVTSATTTSQNKTSPITSVKTKNATNPTPDHSQLNHLMSIGCVRVGSWERSGRGIKLTLHTMQATSPVLYVFVSNDQVLYVGKTAQFLSKRLYSYSKPGLLQSTNIRVNKLLKTLLARGGAVDIFALENKPVQKIGVFTVNIPAALEDNIIKQLKPAWNIRK